MAYFTEDSSPLAARIALASFAILDEAQAERARTMTIASTTDNRRNMNILP